MEFAGKKVLVIGTGKSGISAAKLLDKKCEVVLHDSNEKLNKEDVLAKLPADYRGKISTGALTEDEIKETDIAVISPGVPIDCEDVNNLRNAGAVITGEIETGYLFSKGRLVAITGTNGKTTTTTLVGEIMKKISDSVFVVGNIGIPYTDNCELTNEKSITVAEISSFQLETADKFHPNVSAILNITPDHLNRHHTMEKYIEMKESICKNQTLDDVIVLNYEDQYLREFGEKVTNTKVAWFSSARELEEGYYLDGKDIVYKHEGVKKVLVNVDELNIIGKHNYENVMAACAMAIAMEVPFDKLHEALTEFVAVEHRIEYTCTKKGVKYYNDSKGTNPDAAIQAIRAMQSPTYLIGGGYDKGSEFDEWINAFDGKVKKLVLIGVTAKKIAETCDRLGFKDYVFMDTFEEAVNYCAEHAVSGENVLLSPACASWDMFKSYEERGRIFKELARKLPD